MPHPLADLCDALTPPPEWQHGAGCGGWGGVQGGPRWPQVQWGGVGGRVPAGAAATSGGPAPPGREEPGMGGRGRNVTAV